MERLDNILFSIGEKQKENIKLDSEFYEKTMLAIKKKKKEFFSISGLVFAVFIMITYISGVLLTSINNKIYNVLSIYIFLVTSFFTISFTIFWLISNERFVTKFLDKIFKRNIVEDVINQKGKCFFS